MRLDSAATSSFDKTAGYVGAGRFDKLRTGTPRSYSNK
jgi:hypothetical protein